MKDLVKAYKNLDWILKLILCIPAIQIVTSVVRVLDGIVSKDVVKIIVGILLIVVCPFSWIIDLVCVILTKRHFML